jgi:glyoxylase-like metal-dependent hydrolase (beta-lactamase superfamily II)
MRPRTSAVALFALGTICVAYAQQPPAKPISEKQVQISFLRNEVYFLSVGRANAVAAVTGGGIVLLDAMPAGWGPAMLEALQQVSYMPVTTIINTHAHEDHAGADAEYPDPVQFVMHENSSRRLARKSGAGRTVKTFSDHMPVTLGNRPLHVYYFGKGHTDGDAIVVIPDIRTAFTGDLFAEKALPVVDPAFGGSALALPQTLARAAKEITGVDRVITGHGRWPAAGVQGWPAWTDFQQYAEFVREFVDAVSAGWKNGRSAEQVGAELRMPDKYKEYRLDGAKAMIETIFNELKQSPTPKR